MSENIQRGDELFETLSKNKKKRRRKVLRTVLIIIAVVALILVGAVIYLRHRVEQRFANAAADVQSYVVQTGTINTVVAGSGTLTQVDLEDITVPAGVEIIEVLAENRDVVKAGDVLATVDMASVMTALSDIQEQLDTLDNDIADAKGDTVSSSVTAGISGRVKRIFAQPGTDVTACMAENAALAHLSLDGFMAADIETELLHKGDAVTVLRADGTAITGKVDTVAGGKATVLVTDNGPLYGDKVTVVTGDGTEIGTGELYIHVPLAVTGYAGTVSGVSVKENAVVYGYTTLFRLTNTNFSANYDTLLRDRADLEETLMELLTIYRDGAVTAPFDGVVTSVLFDEEAGEGQTDVLVLYPNESMSITISIDETDILALEEGQEAEVVVSSVSEDPLSGLVTELSKDAITTSGVTVYSAEITVDNLAGMLPGMTADVDVKIEGVENALIIPVDALTQTSAKYYVYTSYDPETQRYGDMKEVTIGMQNDNFVEVLSGLQEGQTVYYTETVNPFAFMFSAMSGNQGSQRPAGNMGGAPNRGNGAPAGNMGGANRGG